MSSRRIWLGSRVASTLKQATLHVTTEAMLSPVSTVKRANLCRDGWELQV